jgi:hypothetical protein
LAIPLSPGLLFASYNKTHFMYNAEEEDNKPQKTTPEPDPAVTTPTGSNAEKDPDEWITGSEAMTGAQKSYLKTLSDEAGEEFNENLSKAEASKRIEELQKKTGRGLSNKNQGTGS